MAIKKISLDAFGNGQKQDKIAEYWLKRDRLIYETCDDETRRAIEERYGGKDFLIIK